MPVQDSDPERRNLMVTSLGFIAYYLAGGHVVENKIRIQVINISFDYPIVLAVMAWLMLLWFALRYWQTHRNEALKHIKSSMILPPLGKVVKNYVVKYRKTKNLNNIDVSVIRIEIESDQFIIKYKYSEGNGSGRDSLVIDNKTLDGFIVLAKQFILSSIKRPEFSGYAMPYVFFYTAVASPLIRYFFICD